MKTKLFINVIPTLFIICFLFGCTDEKNFEVDETFYVNSSSLDIFYGDKINLTASPISGSYQWSSENIDNVTVSASGEVEAVGIGTTNVIVSNGSIEKKIPITVTIPNINGVSGRPGKERAMIELDIKSHLIKTVRITRVDTEEFMDVDVDYKPGTYIAYYDGLSEAEYPFNVVSIDKFDMKSEPTDINVQVYGEIYASKIFSRKTKVVTAFGNGLAIGWGSSAGTFVDLSYTTSEGEAVIQRADATTNSSCLMDYGLITDFSYVTGYLPEPSAVDTFYTEHVNITSTEINKKFAELSSSGESVIAAADFDLGGDGIGFHDSDKENSANNYDYRENLGDYNSRGCDVESGGNLGYTNAGEWVMYTVYVDEPGFYTIDFHVSVNSIPAKCHIEVDGNVSTTYDMESNGSWGDFRYYCEHNSLKPPRYNLAKGFHKIKFYFETGNFNYNGLKLSFQ